MKRGGLALLIASLALLTGCVERRIYLRSDPPGARVFIDGEYVGKTRKKADKRGPLYVNFIYYGTRDYTFRLPGYRTESGTVELDTPWYEYPPIDFFAEVLVPWYIVDEHQVEAKLVRASPADVDKLYRDAMDYRYNSRPSDRYEYAAHWSWTRRPAGE